MTASGAAFSRSEQEETKRAGARASRAKAVFHPVRPDFRCDPVVLRILRKRFAGIPISDHRDVSLRRQVPLERRAW